MTLTSTLEEITPEQALRMLDSNTENRLLNHQRVKVIANDISEGRWQVNGDSIRFDEHGIMVDGQHRLAAIAKAGVVVQSFVTRGLPVAARKTLDQGKMRGFHDVLRIERGVKQSAQLAAVTLAIMTFEKAVAGGTTSQRRIRSVSIGEALGWYDARADQVREVMLAARRLATPPTKLPVGGIAPTLYGASLISLAVMEAFTNSVQHGTDGPQSAATALREYGIRRSQVRDKPSPEVVSLIAVRAFNRWITDTPTVKVTPGKNPVPGPIRDEMMVAVFPADVGA